MVYWQEGTRDGRCILRQPNKGNGRRAHERSAPIGGLLQVHTNGPARHQSVVLIDCVSSKGLAARVRGRPTILHDDAKSTRCSDGRMSCPQHRVLFELRVAEVQSALVSGNTVPFSLGLAHEIMWSMSLRLNFFTATKTAKIEQRTMHPHASPTVQAQSATQHGLHRLRMRILPGCCIAQAWVQPCKSGCRLVQAGPQAARNPQPFCHELRCRNSI